MRRALALSLLTTVALGASSANAAVQLIAKGTLTGSSAGAGVDLSGLTGAMENGLPGNVLGGMGSGLAYAGGNTFYATPDRGPNATSYNPAVDDTVSYITRFQTLNLKLTPNGGAGLPFTLGTDLKKTTLFFSKGALNYGTGAGLGVGPGDAVNTPGKNYFTGRSDNYGAGDSGNPLNARFDPESIRVSADGKSVFVSDEYGPYVRQFSRASGRLIKTFTLPSELDVTNQSPNSATEIAGNPVGRIANKGMEGLAITPDGKTLVGIMQNSLEQDQAFNSKRLRLVTIDVATGATHEYAYDLTTGSGVSDIVAINDHEFLVDERDGKGLGDGSTAKVKQLFKIDISGATDIKGFTGAQAAAATPVTKGSTAFLDIVSTLAANGVGGTQVPAKIEGIAFGQDVDMGGQSFHTLYVANDNDFVPGVAGPSQFFVYAFQDRDLPGFSAQSLGAVPEPATWTMMILGVAGIGGMLRSRRRQPAAPAVIG